MTKADQAVDTAADRLERFVRSSRSSGGLKAKLGNALADDPEFVRKLKPSLIARRARGEAPGPEPAPRPPSEPQTPPQEGSRSGVSPWLVLGAAFVVGIALAKVIDWRGHAHPR